MSDPNVIEQPEARPVVACSDWLAAINRHLDNGIVEMKEQMKQCETPSQKNALGTAILTVNALSWAINNARMEMAANDQAQRPPPETPGRLQQSRTNYPNRSPAQRGGGSLQRSG